MKTRLRKFAEEVLDAGSSQELLAPHTYVNVQTVSLAVIVAFLTYIGFGAFYSIFAPTLAWVHFIAGIFFFGAYVYFRRTLISIAVVRTCCAVAVLTIGAVNWAYGGIMSPAISWFVLPAIASALILGWRDGWYWILVGCICATFFFVVGYYDGIPETTIPSHYIELATYMYCLTFATMIGIFFSFWVSRQKELEARFSSSLEKSEIDALRGTFLARTAIAANGNMGFSQAATVCLELLCEGQGWPAGRIWRVNSDSELLNSGELYVAPLPNLSEAASSCVTTAAASAEPAVGFADNFQAADESNGEAFCVLAWPVEVDGTVDLVLEFFNDAPIALDEDTRTVVRHVAVQLSDVRTRQTARQRIEKLAFSDLITGLPNRAGFEHLFVQKLKDANRVRAQVALMFIDLDGFKRVNDSLGHTVGDWLLQVAAKRLEQNLRAADVAGKLNNPTDIVAARLGGDEFTLIISNLDGPDEAATVARRFLELLAEPIDVGIQELTIGASIGIAMFPDDGTNMSDLMRLADAAMYEAKEVPGNQFCFSTPTLNNSIQRRLWIESALHIAIRRSDLKLMFAPICSATSGRIIANEVALRWPHRDGEIAFKEFSAVAESSYLICDVGLWVMEKAYASLPNIDGNIRVTSRPA